MNVRVVRRAHLLKSLCKGTQDADVSDSRVVAKGEDRPSHTGSLFTCKLVTGDPQVDTTTEEHSVSQ